jgi:hypothetical protein
MKESKIELNDRLRREGRWNEAAVWKDAKIKELRATSMKRADAKEEAWRLMAERFPPPPPAPEPDEFDDEDFDDEDFDDEDLDDEDLDEVERDIDDYKSDPQIVALARSWVDDPESSRWDSPFHELMRRVGRDRKQLHRMARDRALLDAYFHELVQRDLTSPEQQSVPVSATSDAEKSVDSP